MASEMLTPRDVPTTLNYHRPRDEIAYCHVSQVAPEGVRRHNVITDPQSVVIHDARGKQDAFGLDTSGFQWVNYPSVEKEFVDEERIKSVYYPEVEYILKKYVDGAKRVFFLDYIVRGIQNPGPGLKVRGAAHIVHCDYTFAGAEQEVRALFPDEAERLLKGRYRIINVWRPIANNVAHNPLAVADFRIVGVDADSVPVRRIYSGSENGSFHFRYNPRHEWYYLSDQTPDEAIVFKCIDSDTDKARFAPHSAFLDLTSPADAPHRQSIEVRALVFDTV